MTMEFKGKFTNSYGILFLVLASPMISAANIDCHGKAFHCVNSTHFMICVDLGGGISSTIDSFIIPCPVGTECQGYNNFECEFVPSTTQLSIASEATNEKNESTTVSWEKILPFQNVTEAPAEKYYNTVSLTTEEQVSTTSESTQVLFTSVSNIENQTLSSTLRNSQSTIFEETTTSTPFSNVSDNFFSNIVTSSTTEISTQPDIITTTNNYSTTHIQEPIHNVLNKELLITRDVVNKVKTTSLNDAVTRTYEDPYLIKNINQVLIINSQFQTKGMDSHNHSSYFNMTEQTKNELPNSVKGSKQEVTSRIDIVTDSTTEQITIILTEANNDQTDLNLDTSKNLTEINKSSNQTMKNDEKFNQQTEQVKNINQILSNSGQFQITEIDSPKITKAENNSSYFSTIEQVKNEIPISVEGSTMNVFSRIDNNYDTTTEQVITFADANNDQTVLSSKFLLDTNLDEKIKSSNQTSKGEILNQQTEQIKNNNQTLSNSGQFQVKETENIFNNNSFYFSTTEQVINELSSSIEGSTQNISSSVGTVTDTTERVITIFPDANKDQTILISESQLDQSKNLVERMKTSNQTFESEILNQQTEQSKNKNQTFSNPAQFQVIETLNPKIMNADSSYFSTTEQVKNESSTSIEGSTQKVSSSISTTTDSTTEQVITIFTVADNNQFLLNLESQLDNNSSYFSTTEQAKNEFPSSIEGSTQKASSSIGIDNTTQQVITIFTDVNNDQTILNSEPQLDINKNIADRTKSSNQFTKESKKLIQHTEQIKNKNQTLSNSDPFFQVIETESPKMINAEKNSSYFSITQKVPSSIASVTDSNTEQAITIVSDANNDQTILNSEFQLDINKNIAGEIKLNETQNIAGEELNQEIEQSENINQMLSNQFQNTEIQSPKITNAKNNFSYFSTAEQVKSKLPILVEVSTKKVFSSIDTVTDGTIEHVIAENNSFYSSTTEQAKRKVSTSVKGLTKKTFSSIDTVTDSTTAQVITGNSLNFSTTEKVKSELSIAVESSTKNIFSSIDTTTDNTTEQVIINFTDVNNDQTISQLHANKDLAERIKSSNQTTKQGEKLNHQIEQSKNINQTFLNHVKYDAKEVENPNITNEQNTSIYTIEQAKNELPSLINNTTQKVPPSVDTITDSTTKQVNITSTDANNNETKVNLDSKYNIIKKVSEELEYNPNLVTIQSYYTSSSNPTNNTSGLYFDTTTHITPTDITSTLPSTIEAKYVTNNIKQTVRNLQIATDNRKITSIDTNDYYNHKELNESNIFQDSTPLISQTTFDPEVKNKLSTISVNSDKSLSNDNIGNFSQHLQINEPNTDVHFPTTDMSTTETYISTNIVTANPHHNNLKIKDTFAENISKSKTIFRPPKESTTTISYLDKSLNNLGNQINTLHRIEQITPNRIDLENDTSNFLKSIDKMKTEALQDVLATPSLNLDKYYTTVKIVNETIFNKLAKNISETTQLKTGNANILKSGLKGNTTEESENVTMVSELVSPVLTTTPENTLKVPHLLHPRYQNADMNNIMSTSIIPEKNKLDQTTNVSGTKSITDDKEKPMTSTEKAIYSTTYSNIVPSTTITIINNSDLQQLSSPLPSEGLSDNMQQINQYVSSKSTTESNVHGVTVLGSLTKRNSFTETYYETVPTINKPERSVYDSSILSTPTVSSEHKNDTLIQDTVLQSLSTNTDVVDVDTMPFFTKTNFVISSNGKEYANTLSTNGTKGIKSISDDVVELNNSISVFSATDIKVGNDLPENITTNDIENSLYKGNFTKGLHDSRTLNVLNSIDQKLNNVTNNYSTLQPDEQIQTYNDTNLNILYKKMTSSNDAAQSSSYDSKINNIESYMNTQTITDLNKRNTYDTRPIKKNTQQNNLFILNNSNTSLSSSNDHNATIKNLLHNESGNANPSIFKGNKTSLELNNSYKNINTKIPETSSNIVQHVIAKSMTGLGEYDTHITTPTEKSTQRSDLLIAKSNNTSQSSNKYSNQTMKNSVNINTDIDSGILKEREILLQTNDTQTIVSKSSAISYIELHETILTGLVKNKLVTRPNSEIEHNYLLVPDSNNLPVSNDLNAINNPVYNKLTDNNYGGEKIPTQTSESDVRKIVSNTLEKSNNIELQEVTSNAGPNKRHVAHSLNKTESVEKHKFSDQFECRSRPRGRYADNADCRKFYICIGHRDPIVGACPQNTVFSESRKQCTKNLSHCIINNQFRCMSEGRFNDLIFANVYYICVKSNLDSYVRFKLKCQNGYILNKVLVKCEYAKPAKLSDSTSISNNSENNSESSSAGKSKTTIAEKRSNDNEKSLTSKIHKFECEKAGKFADLHDCRKYYICLEIKDNVYRRKKKRCDSDEVFDKDKKRCVDAESNECK